MYNKDMYLISLYFDEETEKKIKQLMKQVFKKVGNDSMLNIPAHLTLASFYCDKQEAIEKFNKIDSSSFELDFVSLGFFLPSVFFIQPIQSVDLEECMKNIHIVIDCSSDRYKPNHWIPHVTLCKHLNLDELSLCLEAIQSEFKPFKGTVKKIGLAKTNPYEDICVKLL